MKKALLFIFMASLCSLAKGQFNYSGDDQLNFGFQVGADYDAPLGELGAIYNPAISPNVSLLLSKGKSFTVNVTVGYHKYKPKAEAFSYTLEDDEMGISTYSDYSVKSAYLGFFYKIPFSETVRGLAGANFGAYFTDYETSSIDSQQWASSSFAEKNIYISPKIGLSLNLTESIAVRITAKYNVFSPAGRNDLQTFGLSSNLDVVYTSWSSGFGLSYIF